MAVKEEILELIKRKGAVSFVELCRDVPGFKGEHAMGMDTNIILWNGVSDEAIEALNELRNENKILGSTTSRFVYLVDGVIPQLPLAKSPGRKYKHLHWLPVIFSTPEQLGSNTPSSTNRSTLKEHYNAKRKP